ncbi:MAG TPA: aminopeptidase [Aggregatilineaceae bacterium]|jgi:aminopeptidase|nr:aminopeptidase [Aggregatilineaceae bacterium]
MMEHFASELAHILTAYSSPVQPGEMVTITGNVETAGPLIEALVSAVLARGGFPNVQSAAPISPDYTPYFELLMREASEAQLDHLDSTLMHWVNASDALFFVKAPANTKALSSVDPSRLARYRRTIQPFGETYLDRYAQGDLRWTVCAWPTQALAQTAEMGLRGYREFVYAACGLDQPDPVAYWEGFRAMQDRLVEWLKGKSHVEVRGPGIDLSFEYDGRPWINCDGRLNFPDGEIFTSPVEDSVNGAVAFNYPSVYQGYEVDGVRLRFENGRAVEATAAKNEPFLLSQIDLDAGGRVLGEFAVGTNRGVTRFTRNTLFDEKIGGTIHMALGRSYAESHGKNESAIHWDMIHGLQDGGEIWVEGELFYRAGEFMVK